MSKYIRTKDGIYLVEEENELYIYCRNGWYNRKSFALQENDLTSGCEYIGKHRISENFIELIDEFVVFDEMNKCCMEIVGSYSSIKNNGWIGSGFEIYGAIWTDKGLIYVAKMNEKGELELI